MCSIHLNTITDLTVKSSGSTTSPGHQKVRERLTPGGISENAHECLHPNPRSGTTHLPAAPSAGCFTQATSNTGTQMQSSADRLHRHPKTPAHQRKRTHLLPPESRQKSLPTQSLHKTPTAETKSKK